MKKKSESNKNMEIIRNDAELMAIPDCRFGINSLEINPEISDKSLNKLGEILFKMKRSGTIKFWFGDWYLFCLENNRAFHLLDVISHSFKDRTIKNILWVCRKVEPARRRENLSFAHHQEVAPLSPEHQENLLYNAERQGWTLKEIRVRKNEHLMLSERRKNEEEEKLYITTSDNAYSYSEYIKLLNRSVKSLNNKLLNLRRSSGSGPQNISPQLCRTAEEKEFTKNCARLYWNLDRLLNEHLLKLALLRFHHSHDPLLLEDVLEFNTMQISTWIANFPYSGTSMKHSLSETYPLECLFGECRRLADLFNKGIRRLENNFEDLSKIYNQKSFLIFHPFKKLVDEFRIRSFAIIINLMNLFKVINSQISEPPDEDRIDEMIEDLFDLDEIDKAKKSKIKRKIQELIDVINED